jgi:O-antigen ligase
MCLLLLTVLAIATPFDPWFSLYGWGDLSEAAEKIASGSLSRQVALITLGVFAIVSLLRGSQKQIRINGLLGYIVIFFLFFSALSIIISDNYLLTAKRVIVLLTLSLGALAIATRMTLHGIITMAFCAGIFSLVSGFLCEVVLGTFNPLNNAYRFTGVLDPNFQASNCSMLLIASVASTRMTKRIQTKLFYLAIAMVAFAFLIFTKSRTGMVGAIVGFVIYSGLVSPRKTAICVVALLNLCCSLYLFADDELSSFGLRLLTLDRADIGDIGQNLTTLTGRTELWETTIFPNIKEHLMFGYGYDSFWSASRVATQSKYELGSSHNGYLHLLMGLGLTGLSTYVLIRILGIIAWFRLFKRSGNAEYAFAFALLISFSLIIGSLDIQLSPHLATFIDMTLLARIALVARPGA